VFQISFINVSSLHGLSALRPTFGGMLRLRAPTPGEGMAWFLPVGRTIKHTFGYKSTPPFLFEQVIRIFPLST